MISSGKITISDIAKAAFVSKTTVSYVINRRQSGFRISEETARRVLNVCKELNYRPAEAAVRLSECRKNPLRLLVVSPWLYAQFSDFMARLNIVLHQCEEESPLDAVFDSYTPGELRSVLRPSLLKRFDAVLVVGTCEKDDLWLRRNQDGLSNVILMNRQVEGFLSCSGDDRSAIQKLTEKIDFAHYDKMLMAISPRRSFCEQLRCSSFAQVCETMNRKCKPLFLEDYTTLWQQIRPVLKKAQNTLVFVPQYVPAALLLQKARAAGFRIPEKLGIIAYDRHSLLDPFVSPSLTTVDPCLEKMTEKALTLVRGMKEQRKQHPCIVHAKLRLGETTVNKKS